MIIGYEIKCAGMEKPVTVKGNTYDECVNKFKEYYQYDYDYDCHNITYLKSIDFNFQIE